MYGPRLVTARTRLGRARCFNTSTTFASPVPASGLVAPPIGNQFRPRPKKFITTSATHGMKRAPRVTVDARMRRSEDLPCLKTVKIPNGMATSNVISSDEPARSSVQGRASLMTLVTGER